MQNMLVTSILIPKIVISAAGSRFRTGLPSRIFGCKSNRPKMGTI